MSAWSNYVVKIAGTTNQSAIARKVGISQPTVGRWFAGSVPEGESVQKFADAYGLDPSEAFLVAAAEHIKTVERVERADPPEQDDEL